MLQICVFGFKDLLIDILKYFFNRARKYLIDEISKYSRMSIGKTACFVLEYLCVEFFIAS